MSLLSRICEEEIDVEQALITIRRKVLILTILATARLLSAEVRCPKSTASVTPRLVRGTLIVVPVKINQRGPFAFVVDTGSQATVVDPALASYLNLRPEGSVGLVSAAGYAQAFVSGVESVELNDQTVDKSFVIVEELGQMHAAEPSIRGVLGENFLGHFDLLVDYRHKVVCLDATNTLAETLHGEHIPLVAPRHPKSELPFTQRLVISAHLSDVASRSVSLQLDSGSDGMILFPHPRSPELATLEKNALRARTVDQAFAVLAPQDVRIGNCRLSHVSFVTPVHFSQTPPVREEDGVLPTVLFQSVFISHAHRYVIFDPK
jgi:gag-polyprotein putative aspartyl protease